MRRALTLARRGLGTVSPNPMVGAILVRRGRMLGQGWHRRAGGPHAEIEALRDAARRGANPRGATLYVTLEPCSTQGRTPPCTDALRAAGVARVVAGATDPNPRHAGRGFDILARAGIEVVRGLREAEAVELNEVFHHWILTRRPFVTVKAAMTLDGKIATASGESRWITGPAARAHGMRLRRAADAVLVGVNTVLADDPALTLRGGGRRETAVACRRRIVLDSRARTPVTAQVVADAFADRTQVVVTGRAPRRRVKALAERVRVIEAPEGEAGGVALDWLMTRLGEEPVASILVEGGGEVNGAFFRAQLVQRAVFFFAPRILGGKASRRGVAGPGAAGWPEVARLHALRWRRVGDDLLITGRVAYGDAAPPSRDSADGE